MAIGSAVLTFERRAIDRVMIFGHTEIVQVLVTLTDNPNTHSK